MKLLKNLGSFLLHILFVLLLLLLVLWIGLLVAKLIVYPDYMQHKETVCTLPDIHAGYVPQGVDHVADDVYLLSGYHGNDILSLYVSDHGEIRTIIPVDAEGNRLISHGDGVTSVKDFVYVTEASRLLIFSLSELLAAEDGEKVACIDIFDVDTASSFCYADDNYIYVGEFYYANEYEIDFSHSFTTPAGERHRALVSCYPLAADGSIADAYPLYSISITGMVQGFAVKGDTFILSRSWGLNSSKLEFYTGLQDSLTTTKISGKSVPLYYLDSSNLTKTLLMPAFSEDLDIVGDRVIISFESACNKYFVGKLFFADKVISYPIP